MINKFPQKNYKIVDLTAGYDLFIKSCEITDATSTLMAAPSSYGRGERKQ